MTRRGIGLRRVLKALRQPAKSNYFSLKQNQGRKQSVKSNPGWIWQWLNTALRAPQEPEVRLFYPFPAPLPPHSSQRHWRERADKKPLQEIEALQWDVPLKFVYVLQRVVLRKWKWWLREVTGEFMFEWERRRRLINHKHLLIDQKKGREWGIGGENPTLIWV